MHEKSPLIAPLLPQKSFACCIWNGTVFLFDLLDAKLHAFTADIGLGYVINNGLWGRMADGVNLKQQPPHSSYFPHCTSSSCCISASSEI